MAIHHEVVELLAVIELGNVPFYWRTKPSPGAGGSGIPDRLPFHFDIINELQLVIQHRQPEVLDWLKIVYTRDSNVGYLQEGHSLAQSYGDDFLGFIERSRTSTALKVSLADIGCGGVYLLERLRTQGYDVLGIDPSPVTIRAGERCGIRIIPEFFPSSSINEVFDVIVHYDVLEHTEDPIAFLKAHHRHLTEFGEIVLAVPDCTTQIAEGDISMMLHEHLNYFDEISLQLTLESAGFLPIAIERSSHGGVLFCRARRGGDVKRTIRTSHSDKFNHFAQLVNQTRSSISNTLRMALTRNEEVGCYVPLRAFPYLGPALNDGTRLRLFDDDPGIHGRYFDGVNLPVENMTDLIARPPHNLIVFSRAFGEQIRNRVVASTDKVINIMLLSEISVGGASGHLSVRK